MKKLLLLTTIVFMNFLVFSQNNSFNSKVLTSNDKKSCITIGILQGGGSLLGIDFENLITRKIGIQVGAGFIGFGGGLNFHFRPSIRSSFFSIQYWHQGVGRTYTQSLIGPGFVFRGEKWFTFQIGIGYALEKGPAWPSDLKQPPVMLTYAIGGYIPW